MSKTQYIPVSACVIRTTDKAVLLRFESEEERWVPRSVIEDGSDVVVGDFDAEMEHYDSVDIHIAKWFAEKEGMDG